MKKLLTVLLALLLCFSLTACKNDEKESSETTVKETTISETVVEAPVEETTTTEEVVEVEDTTKVEEVKKENSTLSYWVNFLNKDGSVLQRTTYKYGETPSYNGSTPTYSDYAYYYSFKGWDKKTSPVYGTQTYTALYDIVGEVESKKQSSSNETTVTPNYLTFTAVELVDSVLSVNPAAIIMPMFKTGSYQFSMDGGVTWENGYNTTTIVLTKIGNKVMLKGTDCTTDADNHFTFIGKVAASGDVTSLTNGVGGDADLTSGCYAYMFAGEQGYPNTALTTAPNLPSTTLAESCYFCMFKECTSLTNAPVLNAAPLAACCYQFMFYNCSSLYISKGDPGNYTKGAILVGNSSNCTYMFTGCNCSGFSDTPTDSSKTYYWYQPYLTFTAVDYTPDSGETKSWSITPNFVSGTWEYSTDGGSTWNTGYIYQYDKEISGVNYYKRSSDNGNSWSSDSYPMLKITLANVGDSVLLRGNYCTSYNPGIDQIKPFEMTGSIAASGDVTSLTNGVGGDVDLTPNCYLGMFQGCASLTTAPNLPSTTLAENCYSQMFSGCTSLTIAPNLPATTLAKGCYVTMFSGCSSLLISKGVPSSCTTMGQIFVCPSDVPVNVMSIPAVYCMFSGCNSAGFTSDPTPGNTYYWYTE